MLTGGTESTIQLNTMDSICNCTVMFHSKLMTVWFFIIHVLVGLCLYNYCTYKYNHNDLDFKGQFPGHRCSRALKWILSFLFFVQKAWRPKIGFTVMADSDRTDRDTEKNYVRKTEIRHILMQMANGFNWMPNREGYERTGGGWGVGGQNNNLDSSILHEESLLLLRYHFHHNSLVHKIEISYLKETASRC